MGDRKKAKRGYRQTYLLADDGKRVFSEAAVKKLAIQFKLPGRVPVSELRHRLDMAALVFRTWRQNADMAPRRGEMKAALDEIVGLSERLQRRLDELDDISAGHFWRPETVLRHVMSLGPEGPSATEYGHSLTWLPTADGHAILYLGGEHFAPVLKLIGNYASAAIANLPKDVGGRKRSEGLRYWAINIAKIWTELFGKPFTFDEYKGEPITEAARFAVAAMAIADPSVAASEVRAAVRAYIRELGPGRGRKNQGRKTP